MTLKQIEKLIERVVGVASQAYPTGDSRPEELRTLGKELQSSVDRQQRKTILLEIKRFLSAGMGGFMDAPLLPPVGMEFGEFSLFYSALVGELYVAVEKELAEGA